MVIVKLPHRHVNVSRITLTVMEMMLFAHVLPVSFLFHSCHRSLIAVLWPDRHDSTLIILKKMLLVGNVLKTMGLLIVQ